MSAIPSLWPADIRADMRTPVAILRRQEGGLSAQTAGLLEAKLSTVTAAGRVQYALDIVAPSLHSERVRILTAEHAAGMPYPVTVEADVFQTPVKPTHRPGISDAYTAIFDANDAMYEGTPAYKARRDALTRNAYTEEEFTDLLRQVFASPAVRSVIASFVARINSEEPDPASTSVTAD